MKENSRRRKFDSPIVLSLFSDEQKGENLSLGLYELKKTRIKNTFVRKGMLFGRGHLYEVMKDS
jgi:hypothetical protein